MQPGKWGADKANAKGQVRIELAAHFVKARLWGPLLQLVAPVIRNHQVGAMPWVDVCTEWWEAFAAMAEVSWKEDFLSGAEQRALLQRQLTMGARHLDLGRGKTLWMHMWIDHMYAYVARWGTIAKCSCFALEGSHVRLKRLLRNSGGVSLLNNRLGLQCVVLCRNARSTFLLTMFSLPFLSRRARDQVVHRRWNPLCLVTALLSTSQPSLQRLSSSVWLSTK